MEEAVGEGSSEATVKEWRASGWWVVSGGRRVEGRGYRVEGGRMFGSKFGCEREGKEWMRAADG